MALDEAVRRSHESAEPEHLLLGVLQQPDCAAYFMLQRLDAIENVRGCLERRLSAQSRIQGPESKIATDLSPASYALLDAALDVAIAMPAGFVGTEHLLLAALKGKGELATELAALHVEYDAAHEALLDLYRYGWQKERPPAPRRLLLRAGQRISRVIQYAKFACIAYIEGSIADPRLKRDPFPIYRRMAGKPIRRDPVAGIWLATRYSDVVSVLRDPRFIRRGPTYSFDDPDSHLKLPDPVRKKLAIATEFFPRQMLFENPPNHARLRGLVSSAFTPSVVERMRPRVQAITDRLLDAAEARGRMDVIKDFATPLPITVIAELLGVPAGDDAKLKEWSDDIAELFSAKPMLATARRTTNSIAALREYFGAILQTLRCEPAKDGLLSALLSVEAAGEKLSNDELFANSALLLAAGHETTTNLIGNGLLALLKHPDQMSTLRQNSASIPEAIEELLRYDSPVQWTSRLAGEDLEIQGRRLRKNELILIGLGPANHDPEQFPHPERLDLMRKENRHLAFGQGIHFCIGAALARLEGEIAFTSLLRRFPAMCLESEKIEWRGTLFLRGMKSLNVCLK